MPLHKLLTLAVLLLAITTTSAQKNTNLKRVESLKTVPANKDARIVSFKHTSSYLFGVAGNQVVVEAHSVKDMISLTSNVNHVEPVYCNDNIKIDQTDVKYSSGREIDFQKVCGNVEVADVFYSDQRVCAYQFSFTFEGTEITFDSHTRYTDARYFTSVFFNESNPVSNREVSFLVPNAVQVELIEKNFEGYKIVKSVSATSEGTLYKYQVTDLKEMKQEPNSLGVLHHYPHILVLTKGFTEGSEARKTISTVDDLYKWYSSLVLEVKDDPSTFEGQVTALTQKLKSREEKIKAIYYWVQDNIRYVAFEDGIAGFRPASAQDVYNKRFGDCKGMANLTKQMLTVAGFDARLAWIGTNRIPYTYDTPTLAVDNHMICVVSDNDVDYILDSTEKFNPLGTCAERIQGKEMLIENGDSYILKKVPVANPEENLESRTETLVIDGNSLVGSGQLQVAGESKTHLLNISSLAADDVKKMLTKLAITDFTNTDVVELNELPAFDRDLAFSLSYQYKLGNQVSDFDKDMYVNFDWQKSFGGITLDQQRETDYYFGRKIRHRIQRRFTIPTGYKLTHVPVDVIQRHDDFIFTITFRQEGNEVVYLNEITVPSGIIRKKNFETWNAAIISLNELYNDSIVLSKN